MLSTADFAAIAEACKAIGDDATDETGFVPVRNLLRRFKADVLSRPLLVEGMLASLSSSRSDGGSNDQQWIVLIDSERYSQTNRDIEEERSHRPLPARLRNTIAHELVHALAFRSSEFGLRLKTNVDTKEGLRKVVEAIEEKTEELSPLLLLTEKSLAFRLRGKKETLRLSDWLDIIEGSGISRYVLINRLGLLRPATDTNGFLFSAGLRNVGLGIGVWGAGIASMKGWPLFWNFDDGLVPTFLLKLNGHDRVPANRIFDDSKFAMLGGPHNVIAFETTAGTRAVPDAKRLLVEISVEERLRRDGEEFLFVVRGNAS
jgi:hypothetical protein